MPIKVTQRDADREAWDAMENNPRNTEQDPMLDWDKKMESVGVTHKKFRSLFLESKGYDGSDDPFRQNEWLSKNESYSKMKSLYDPETYRQRWSEFKDVGMIGGMMADAKSYMKEMRVGVEKGRFEKNYGSDAADKWEVPSEVFEEKRGYENWMRKEGLFDSKKTEGLKGIMQRILPGGKKGYTRDHVDPRSERSFFSGKEEAVKKGAY